MKISISFLSGLLLLLPVVSFANAITTTGSITAFGEGSVSYTLFDQDQAGRTRISVKSRDFDTHIFLFENDGMLDASDYVTRNDDGGRGLNSLINVVLNSGSYILATSDYHLSLSEAISGYNRNNYFGDYRVKIKSKSNVSFSSVPEPTTLSLLGLGLLGVRLSQRLRKR
ncbi:MAG: PEP-CTERM sorting domain-containing protein [Candidatus Thiodiazotropha sp.]|jgi:hypothetical protein